MRYSAIFLALLLSIPFAAAAYASCAAVPASVLAGKTCRELSSGPSSFDAQTLSQANSYYLLINDISCTGSCFSISASNVVLDLNEKTLTYGNSAPVIVPNFNFESGASGWDLSQAPSASVTSSFPAARGSWHTEEIGASVLKFSVPTTLQYVISSQFTLETGRRYALSFMINTHGLDAARQVVGTLDVPLQTTRCYGTNVTPGVGTLGRSGFYDNDHTDVWGAANGNGYLGSTGFRCQFTVSQSNVRALLRFQPEASLPTNTRDIYLDAIEVKPYDDRAISVGSYSNIRIINGRIRQGQAKSYYSKGIFLATGSSNCEIGNLDIEVNGPDSVGISAAGTSHDIHHSTINQNVRRTHYSHDVVWYAAAIMAEHITGSKIHHNVIPYSGVGIVVATDANNNEIYGNQINVVSTAIHSYAIATSGWNSHLASFNSFHDNSINTQRGSGIFVESGARSGAIYNNYVEVRDGPQEERDWTAKAIWMRYGIGNFSVYNNTFIGYGGKGFPAAGQDTSIAVARLGSSSAAYGPLYFYNNYVEAHVTSADGPTAFPGIHGIALDLNTDTSTDSLTKYIYGNTFKSNDRIVVLGNDYGSARHSYLSNNRFVKASDALSGFKTIYGGYEGDTDTLMTNNTAEGGASTHDITYWQYGSRDITLKWYLTLKAQDQNGNPIQGASAIILDRTGAQTATGTSDSGGIFQAAVTEQTIIGRGNAPTITMYSPYSVQFTYNGQTITRNSIDMTQSRTETFVFTTTPCQNGATQSCTTSQGCSGSQTCSSSIWGQCIDNNPNDNCPPAPSPSPSVVPSPTISPSPSASPSPINWVISNQENFDSVASIQSNVPFGMGGWLTPHYVNGGQITIENQEAHFQTPLFEQAALLRSTNILPSQYKIRAKVGRVNYDVTSYTSADINNPLFNTHGGDYENGFYWLVISDAVCTGTQCQESWWHYHRKVNMDSDDHLESGTRVVHPFYMVYMAPETNSMGNLLRTWSGGSWHTYSWNWEVAQTYDPNAYYYVEFEKSNNAIIERLYDSGLNLLEETTPVPLNLIYAMGNPAEYLYIGEPHSDDYKGDAWVDEITLWVPATASPSPSASPNPSSSPSPSASPSVSPSPSAIPCTENWSCTGWSACSGGVQTRTCVDLNVCNTTLAVPPESQGCSSGSPGSNSPYYGGVSTYTVPTVTNTPPSASVAPTPSLTVQQEFVVRALDIESELPAIDFDRESQLDIQELLKEAKILQKQGRTEQALALLGRAKTRLNETVSKSGDQKAGFLWQVAAAMLVALLALAFYFIHKRRKDASAVSQAKPQQPPEQGNAQSP